MEKLLSSTEGRYKILKLLQYVARTCLLLPSLSRDTLLARLLHRTRRLELLGNAKGVACPSWWRDRLRALVVQCALQRRLLQLGHLYVPAKRVLLLVASLAHDAARRTARHGGDGVLEDDGLPRAIVLGTDAHGDDAEVDGCAVPSTSASTVARLAAGIAAVCECACEDLQTLAHLRWLPPTYTRYGVHADRAWLASLVLELAAWRRRKRRVARERRLSRRLSQRPVGVRTVSLPPQPPPRSASGRSTSMSAVWQPATATRQRPVSLSASLLHRQDSLARDVRASRFDDAATTLEDDLRRQEWWLDVDGLRVLCDLCQAARDVLDVEGLEVPVTLCALTSSILGVYRFVAMS